MYFYERDVVSVLNKQNILFNEKQQNGEQFITDFQIKLKEYGGFSHLSHRSEAEPLSLNRKRAENGNSEANIRQH